jgi:cholesterol oxidase
VLECGRRFRDEDFAETTWDLRNYLWAPALGLRGILRLSPFKDVFVASGSGVGGGSVVYANTLYRAAPEFFANPQWAALDDWATTLQPHYDTATRMLGVQQVPFESDGQKLLQEVGKAFGAEKTFTRTPCAVFFASPRRCRTPTGGEGWRAPVARGAVCMVGCRVGARTRWSEPCGSRRSAA